MKIWIVSSDPFINDFEKISRYWPKDDTVFITGLSRYEINIHSYFIFAKQYLDFRPDAILTDHGYGGFLLIDILNKVLNIGTKSVFYLRGNWWLESNNQSSKILSQSKELGAEYTGSDKKRTIFSKIKSRSLRLYYKKSSELTITSNGYTDFTLLDTSSGQPLTPFSRKIYKNMEYTQFKNLWQGIFTFTSFDIDTPYEYLIDTKIATRGRINKTVNYEVITKKGFSIGLFYRDVMLFVPSAIITKARTYYCKKLSRFGWKYTLKNIQFLTAVCDYLSTEALKNTGRSSIVIPVPIDLSAYPNKPIDLKLKHPSALIIQNHQIQQKSEALVSFRGVIKKTPKVTYYISMGLPENRKNRFYDNVIKSLSPLKNVVFVDINSKNKYNYLKSVDLYILRSGLDCTPATILEAGLASKPVIASNVGGVPEMILENKTGWCLDNNDNDGWINKINHLTKNISQIQTMGKQNHDYVTSNYDINKVATILRNIFKYGDPKKK
jgi:glycosyltransferase involved in cell wall biosynthesis